ncbi:serine/threonine-protein kinase [Nonomuraea rubra]|uniref:Serine/threonine protein kinase n=1 Tax=Nonomuraea rubra TaxID=46180 RepID=A0A7X0U2G9_9ACTN|nr:serine/threonine-protein kinase [Nonomuraea rubra]MBB6552435.1 serine/threonine protein kinase [Nonomuraea rubra]
MTAVPATPPVPGDPAEVAPYRILGRLGEGGQGVVYLGESPRGERVAVKVLRHGPEADGGPGDWADFAREIELTRRVKAFCTANVLATGDLNGLPYVVSEYVDGPSLAQVIARRGPLRGAELRRLAIGTLTALTAIHQAGVVHRDFKPGNVLLGRDGPRVIDFGIARGLDAGERTAGELVGTPPYMAPEQFSEAGSGPPADLFAWACTIVAAGTGRPPFGSGHLPVVINRILTSEPEVGDLQGDLRELVLRCLAKNPAERPAASRALLALLGHPVPPQRLLATGQESAAPPESRPTPNQEPAAQSAEPGVRAPRRGRRYAAAVAALVLVAGGAAYALTRAPGEQAAQAVTPSPERPVPSSERSMPSPGRSAPSPERSAHTPAEPMRTSSTATVRLPGWSIKVHDNPDDPLWVSSVFGAADDPVVGNPAYVRDPASGTFTFFGNLQTPVVSPGGRYVAALSIGTLARTDFNVLRLVTRRTGEDVGIRTSDKPGDTTDLRWSDDGRLLLSVHEGTGKARRATGFVVVDPVTRAVTVRDVPGGGAGPYVWGPGDSVLHQSGDGAVRLYDLKGAELRSFTGVGELLAANAVTGPGHGTVFGTRCPQPGRRLCLWDAVTGRRAAEVPLGEGHEFQGWLDGEHYLATTSSGGRTRMVMTDLRGKAVRTLVEGPAKELDGVTVSLTVR